MITQQELEKLTDILLKSLILKTKFSVKIRDIKKIKKRIPLALPLLVMKKKHVDLLLIGEGDKKQKGDRKRKTCNKCLPQTYF